MLNRYKHLRVLVSDSAESLADLITKLPYEFSIEAMYGMDGKHYAYIRFDRSVKFVKKKVEERKSLEEIQDKLNS